MATVRARFQQKSDTEANWNENGQDFIPFLGEIIIYLADNAHPYPRLKVGDGITNVINLPFTSSSYINGYYCTCNTPPAIAQKECTIKDFDLVTGITIYVTFTYTNTAATPTLKINGLAAAPIFLSGTAVNLWDDNETIALTYDGAYWRIVNNTAKKLSHKLTFGARQEYTFDGSQDVFVPVYAGTIY